MSWKEWLVGVFAALLVASGVAKVGHYYGKQAGIAEGLTTYHHMCYTNGPGFIVIEDEAVLCDPARGSVRERQLDNGEKTWYNK